MVVASSRRPESTTLKIGRPWPLLSARPRSSESAPRPPCHTPGLRGVLARQHVRAQGQPLQEVQGSPDHLPFAGKPEIPAQLLKPRLFLLRDSLIETDFRLQDARLPDRTEQEFDSYTWDTRLGRDQPIDASNHGLDALRYAVAHVDGQADAPLGLHVLG